MELLTENQYKMLKGEKLGFKTYILHLIPNTLSGHNVCPQATPACISTCLNISSHGRAVKTQAARKRKTLLYFNNRAEFYRLLDRDINKAVRLAEKEKKKLCIRLNGTSDLPQIAIEFAQKYSNIQFYDYTKILKYADTPLPENYHLTFSRSEFNESEVLPLIDKGFNVAVLFDQIPEVWRGYEVIDGDLSDLRFLDKRGVIVGLTPKNKAKFDDTGFLVRITNKIFRETIVIKKPRITLEMLEDWITRKFKARECAAHLGISVTALYMHLDSSGLRNRWDSYQLSQIKNNRN